MSGSELIDTWQSDRDGEAWIVREGCTILATFGAINCLLRGNIGQIVAIPGGARLYVSAPT
jgi:hypothetical protein